MDTLYYKRIETWALYHRKEKELPTRGYNTNNYCESSFRITKEKQFGRVKTYNLVELLEVLCDDSAYYVNKLTDIGNGRDTVLKQANNKYIEKQTKLTIDQVVDLGDKKYLVESETNSENHYVCDMISGYCTCPAGNTCAPCKHKSAVSHHFKEAHTTQTPANDPRQRAMYHYIAWGRTMESSFYRNIGDPHSDPKVEEYIKEKLAATNENVNVDLHESILEDDEAIVQMENVMEEDEDSDTEEEYNDELIRKRFSEAKDAYKNKAISHQMQNPQNPSSNKAMMAMTRTLFRSVNCTPLTFQNQMQNFGKGTVAENHNKHGGVIKVQPTASARRTFKVPGRGPAPLGRPAKDRSGKVQMFVTDEDELMARSDKTGAKEKAKKRHSLAENVDKNETAPKRHTKQ